MSQSACVKRATVVGILLLFAAAMALGQSAGYNGRVGDRIDYLTGTMTLSETDVTQAGRHGLDINLTRTYSSMIYGPDTVNCHHSYKDYSVISDPENYTYLGEGWHIEYPYIYYSPTKIGSTTFHQTLLVHQDGSSEQLFKNLDTLTNDDWPMKTRSLALYSRFNPFGSGSSSPDSLLLTDGTIWVFGHMITNQKFLTKMRTRFGDSLIVTYYPNSRWIDSVVSPIGRKVVFRYCNSADSNLLPRGSTPPDTARLCELQ